MKKVLIIVIFLLILTGCKRQNKIDIKNDEPIQIIEEVKYKDENNVIIGLYNEQGRELKLIQEYKTTIKLGIDIGIFDIYPSNETTIKLKRNNGTDFYDEWIKNENYKNIKIGFNIKYKVEDKEINYNILNPKDTINNYGYILVYLYDDYANRNKSWYSHLTQDEYNEDSLFTSIKLYANNTDNILSKITLTVFTYDTLDDFDQYGQYRGDSSYSITICDPNKTC